jgi:hypothetical protein
MLMPRGLAVAVAERPAVPVGAALGSEGGGEFRDLGAEALQHVAQDVVGADQQAAGLDLARGVPVADMPGEPRQVAGDSIERLLGRLHRDPAAVVELERVAVADGRRLRQVGQEGDPVACDQPPAPQHPLFVVEPDPAMRLDPGPGTPHAATDRKCMSRHDGPPRRESSAARAAARWPARR